MSTDFQVDLPRAIAGVVCPACDHSVYDHDDMGCARTNCFCKMVRP